MKHLTQSIPFLREILKRLVIEIPSFRRTGSLQLETVKIKVSKKPPFIK
jgi:hypothetical protein